MIRRPTADTCPKPT